MATPAAPLPDAVRTNWVDRHAPEALKPWLKLGRFDRPIGIWLLMLPGWSGIALAGAAAQDLVSEWGYYLSLFVAFGAGAALMRAAGCAWNDIVDRDIDARVARTAGRPIPAGQISVRQALGFILVCCLVSLAILLSFHIGAVLIGAASLLLVAAYPFMKRITWWPQAWLGLTFNWGVLLGFFAAGLGGDPEPWTGWNLLGWAATGEAGLALEAAARTLAILFSPFGWPLWTPALLLYACGVFWTLGYDTIYALQDIEDDTLVGVKSSARRLGARARTGVFVFYAVAFSLALAAWWTAQLGTYALPFLLLFGLHLFNQARRLKLDDPALALALFRSNREAGILLVLALAAGMWSYS